MIVRLVYILTILSAVILSLLGLSRQLNFSARSAHFPVSKEARQLHDESFVVDLHTDVLLWPRRTLHEDSGRGHFDFERMQRGGLDGVLLTIPLDVPGLSFLSLRDNAPWAALFDRWQRLDWYLANLRRGLYLYEEQGNGFMPRIWLGLEGGEIVQHEEDFMRLKNRGIFSIGPVHLFSNKIGGANMFGDSTEGLSEFGRWYVTMMQKYGLALDLSHTSDQTFSDMLELYLLPPFISHTGIRSYYNYSRNISVEQARQVAERGGLSALMLSEKTAGRDDLYAVYRQLDELIRAAGEEHVALGGDFDGYVATTVGIDSFDQITAFLLFMGYRPERIKKIMGGNWLTYVERFKKAAADKENN